MSRAKIFILAALAIGSAPKDKAFWEAKPYDSWSKKDCEKVLMNSPWTARYVLGEYGVNTDRFGTDGGLRTSTQAEPTAIEEGISHLAPMINAPTISFPAPYPRLQKSWHPQ
jgi:hypothetical protein